MELMNGYFVACKIHILTKSEAYLRVVFRCQEVQIVVKSVKINLNIILTAQEGTFFSKK